jgi:diguanylate cyclase (GGDEF)-like protein
MSVEKLEEAPKKPPQVPESGVAETLEKLSASYGISLLLVDGHQPPELKAANNNSICKAFQSSQSRSHLCESYCGAAHKRVTSTGNIEHFRCHAGLHCVAVPLKSEGEKKFAIIGGRAFLQAADYQNLIERIFIGDLNGLFDDTVLKNIIFSSRERLNELVEKLLSMSSKDFIQTVKEQEIKETPLNYQPDEPRQIPIERRRFARNSESKTESEAETVVTGSASRESKGVLDPVELESILSQLKVKGRTSESVAPQESKAEQLLEIREQSRIESPTTSQLKTPETRRTLDDLLSETQREIFSKAQERVFSLTQPEKLFFAEETQQSYLAMLKPMLDRLNFASVSLLVRQSNSFATIYLTGRFRRNPIKIQLDPWDERLVQAAKGETSITLKPIQDKNAPSTKEHTQAKSNVIELFPMVFCGNVLGALLIGQALPQSDRRREISAFCREAALQLEIIRLNAELERRSLIFRALRNMAEQVNMDEPSETYRSVLDQSKKLLKAERASLLLFDEEKNELEVRAAAGPRADIASTARLRLGEGIAGTVFEQGRPMLIKDSRMANNFSAYPERHYKTNSFISFPLIIGGRKVGVLNLTDKVDGGTYDEKDLKMIENIAPHLALAIERAEWQEKASEFELMSITDPLTGLLNRRYLEERVDEEVKRCQRNGFPMAFLMIDIDDFKYYNDQNGHQAGDIALGIVSQCMRSVLRSDDVAARYGGEEFSILLPLTSVDEATSIAERIRQKVELEFFPHGNNQPLGRVTVSIGVAAYSATLNTAAAIIGAADRALYLAKRRKKNCVQLPEELQQSIIPFLDASENAN